MSLKSMSLKSMQKFIPIALVRERALRRGRVVGRVLGGHAPRRDRDGS